MDIHTALTALAVPVVIFTAIDFNRFMNGIQARKVALTAKGEQFVLIGRMHGFLPNSDAGQILKYGIRSLAGLMILAYGIYFQYHLPTP